MLCVKCGAEITEEVAFCPFCGEKVTQGKTGTDAPIYHADVKGLLKSGKLTVYHDRTEFATGSIQKAIFNYADIAAVKKGWDSIDFIMEDGSTETCPAGRKTVHEAFVYIEQALKPYLAARQTRLLAAGIRYSLPCSYGLLNTGILNISAEQAEFKAKSGKNDIISFEDVKSVGTSAGTLNFSLFDGETKSFSINKELLPEAAAFVTDSIAPYLAKRKAELLSRGIYYSSFTPSVGTLDIFADSAQFTNRAGQTAAVSFEDIRIPSLYNDTLELDLVDGTS